MVLHYIAVNTIELGQILCQQEKKNPLMVWVKTNWKEKKFLFLEFYFWEMSLLRILILE